MSSALPMPKHAMRRNSSARARSDQHLAVDAAHTQLLHGAADRLLVATGQNQPFQRLFAFRSDEVETVQRLLRGAPERYQVCHDDSRAKWRPERAPGGSYHNSVERTHEVRRRLVVDAYQA